MSSLQGTILMSSSISYNICLMRLIHNKNLIVLCIAGSIAIAAYAQDAKRPERKPQNLKVLPVDISHDSLIAVMHDWENALGVNCSFCHTASKTSNGHLDFASDDNHKKEFARRMFTMTDSINTHYFPWWNGTREGRVLAIDCYTCHHGHAEPEAIVRGAEEHHGRKESSGRH